MSKPLEEMTDAELDALLEKPAAKEIDYDSLSDSDLDALLAEQETASAPDDDGIMGLASSIGRGALDGVISLGNTIDSFTAAPVRKGLDSLKTKGPGAALSDAWAQFGEDPATAPTGPEVARAYGVSSKPVVDPEGLEFEADPIAFRDKQFWSQVPQDKLYGFGVDFGADITNVIPFGTIAKGLSKGSAALAKGATTGAALGADLVTGTKVATKAVDATEKGVGSAVKALGTVLKPGRAEDFPKFLRIAEENGIPADLLPPSIEFGAESFPARASRQRAEGVLGQPFLEKHRAGHEAVQDAFTRKIEIIGNGRPLDPIEAGEHLRSAYDKGLNNFFASMEITYNSMMDAIPGMQLTEPALRKLDSKLNGIERAAKGMVSRGMSKTTKTQGKQLLAAVEAARNANGSYKQTIEAMQDIGREAFRSENIYADIPPDVQKLQDIYFTMRDGVVDTVEAYAGKPVAKVLRENNAAMSDILGDKSLVGGVIGNRRMAPEKVFQSLIMNGDSKRIQALKKIMSPEDFQALKGAFLENLVKRDPDGTFTFGNLRNVLRTKKSVISSLFDPDEVRQVSELIDLGESFGPAILSSSGTGASNVFKSLPSAIGEAVTNDTIIEQVMESARIGKPLASEAPGFVSPAAAGAAKAAPAYVPTKPPNFYERNIQRSRPGNLLKGAQMGAVMSYPREEYEGYRGDQVVDLMPEEIESYRLEINNSNLDSVERAKRLNLMNKYGKRPVQ